MLKFLLASPRTVSAAMSNGTASPVACGSPDVFKRLEIAVPWKKCWYRAIANALELTWVYLGPLHEYHPQ
jgi:hypothetical protein